jgi:shikimate kinase
MPGAGKSTAGVVLAKTLGRQFIDTDILLAKRLGMTLQQFIDRHGITAFLEEEALLGAALRCDDTVIATGGSMVLSERAMENLKKDSIIVFIHVPLGELKRRLRNIRTRGVALSPGQTIGDLYRQRLPLYRQYADITVPEAYYPRLRLEELVEEMAEKIGRYGD